MPSIRCMDYAGNVRTTESQLSLYGSWTLNNTHAKDLAPCQAANVCATGAYILLQQLLASNLFMSLDE